MVEDNQFLWRVIKFILRKLYPKSFVTMEKYLIMNTNLFNHFLTENNSLI